MRSSSPVYAHPRFRAAAGVRVCAVGLAALLFHPACTGCDPPAPVGGLILVIRQIPAPASSPFDQVDSVSITYDRVEALVFSSLDGGGAEARVTLDTGERTIVLSNAPGEVIVSQFQVPVGSVSQLRFFPRAVTLALRDGSQVSLQPDSPALPSWSNTGWKVVPANGEPFQVVQDELSGVRGLMDFSERLVRSGPADEPAKGWKLKPTLPAEPFEVNPAPYAPGVFADQLTVVFTHGTPRSRVDEINAGIGATVIIDPGFTNWYRVKLPSTTNLQNAALYYRGFAEVLALLPATNFANFSSGVVADDDRNSQLFDLVKVRDAWTTTATLPDGGLNPALIGSHRVRVAIIEQGPFPCDHRDLYRNIAINNGELPLGLFDSNDSGIVEPSEIAAYDVDPPGAPDGVITVRDFEALPASSPIQPRLADGGLPLLADGGIDTRFRFSTLLADPRWVDGKDDDNNGFVDDLVGWRFPRQEPGSHIACASTNLQLADHPAAVAGVLAAEANNSVDVAGVSWRVSIVPVVASAFVTDPAVGAPDSGMPDVAFLKAVDYAQRLSVPIVSISQGWHFVRKDVAAPKCRPGAAEELSIDPRSLAATIKIPNTPDAGFDSLRADSDKAYADALGGATSLFVVASGNFAWNLGNPGTVVYPAHGIQAALPGQTLVVGGVRVGSSGAEYANLSSDYATDSTIDIFAPSEDWVVLEGDDGPRPNTSAPPNLSGVHTAPGTAFPETEVGTSFAAPAVAGAAALYLATPAGAGMDAVQLRQKILSTASPSVTIQCGDDVNPTPQRLLDADALLRSP